MKITKKEELGVLKYLDATIVRKQDSGDIKVPKDECEFVARNIYAIGRNLEAKIVMYCLMLVLLLIVVASCSAKY